MNQSQHTLSRFFPRIILMIIAIAVVPHTTFAASEIRSMPMKNKVGSQCTATDMKVEKVSQIEGTNQQEIVISVPASSISEEPELKLYRVDNTAFAFEDYQEINDGNDDSRRSFSFTVNDSDRFSFKVGFDSSQ